MNDMKGTRWGTSVLAAAAALVGGAAAQDLAATPSSEPRPAAPAGAPAAAMVLPALSATSPSGGLRVTVVEGRANTADPVTVRALVARPGHLVDWVRLPLRQVPDALVLPDQETIVCLDRSGAEARVVELDIAGRERRGRALAQLVPAGFQLAPEATIQLAYSDTAVCVAVDLADRSRALVEVGQQGSGALEACSVEVSGGVEAWLERSRDLLRAGDELAARSALEEAQRADPSDPRAYQQLARLHRSAGDRTAQLDCLREGLERSHGGAADAVDRGWRVGTPESRLVLEFVETTRQVRGDEAAGEALGAALTLYPCMEQAVLLRAELLLAAGDVDAAMTSLEVAVNELGEGRALGPALHDIGRFLERAGRPDDAIRFMTRAAAQGEFSEFLIRDLADLHVEAGEPLVAAGWLSKLAVHWRSVSNGASEAERALRGHQRLAELEAEIRALGGTVPVASDP